MNRGFAPAKLNLWLHVGARRRDGFHPVSSLIVFAADVGDRVMAEPADDLTLDLAGPTSGDIGEGPNLVLAAARLFARRARKRRHGAHLTLHKTLPVAAGLGGGSADAAAALRVLNQLWELDWTMGRLSRTAEKIGADVPVCLWSRPSVVSGKGERVELLSSWPEMDAVLVNPGVALPTRDVFARYDAGDQTHPPHPKAPLGMAHRDEAIALLRKGANDLEAPASELVPEVGQVLEALRGTKDCALARLSGSGASCFGLYGDADSAARAAARLSKAHPEWWVRAARLGGSE